MGVEVGVGVGLEVGVGGWGWTHCPYPGSAYVDRMELSACHDRAILTFTSMAVSSPYDPKKSLTK